MDPQEILRYCLEKGLLVDEKVLNALSESVDFESAKLIIEKVKEHTQKKVLTKEIFENNKEMVSEFLLNLPKENQVKLEKLKVKLGIRIEVSKEVEIEKISTSFENDDSSSVKVLSNANIPGKKYSVKDFVTHYRNRFISMRNLLQDRSELKNLVSINKISGGGQRVSIIGIISEKKITKNKNILLEVEDLTGRIRVLINQNKKELYKLAEEISLDTVVGFVGSGNKEIIFVNDLIFPDARLPNRKRSPVEEYALFIGDLQVGSKIFLERQFLKFIDYINGKLPNTPEVEKIKYLFIVGDVVEGVGVFPNQDKELIIKDLESQFTRLAELLAKINRNITIIISPGNHDGVRLMEPQPIFDEKYAWPLFNLKNVILVGNPAMINFGAKKNFEGMNILMYHGFSYPYYSNNVPKFMEEGNALNTPHKIMQYLLKNRHLAPSHKSTQYVPLEKDGLMIREVPDIFVSGHTHKGAVSYYNNILVISSTCWEDLTPFQEKMGNKPDFCKVPIFNLKTRQVKILDFYDGGEK